MKAYATIKNKEINWYNPLSAQSGLGEFEGKMVEVNINLPKRKRTNPQNRFFHGPLLSIMSEAMGELTKKETKEILKSMFLKDYKIIETDKGEIAVEYIKNTSDLSTVEFEEFNEKIRIWAASFLGCVVPYPNEIEEEKT